MKRTRSVIGQAAVWLVIGVLVLLVSVCAVVPRLAGGEPYTILTGSMRPAYPPGTLVAVRHVPFEQIEVGDVITFQAKPGEPTVITHRVVDTTTNAAGERRLITKGDANGSLDDATVQPAQVRGRLWYSLPALGRVNTLISSAKQTPVAIGVACLLFLYAGLTAASAVRDRRERRTDPDPTKVSS